MDFPACLFLPLYLVGKRGSKEPRTQVLKEVKKDEKKWLTVISGPWYITRVLTTATAKKAAGQSPKRA